MPKKKTQEQIVQNLIKLKDGLEEAANVASKGLDDLYVKYIHDVQVEFQFINQHVIDQFYEDYDPDYYDRVFDLYEVSDMFMDMETLNPRIESDYHYLSNAHGFGEKLEYIYNLVYVDGWHGGSRPSKPGKTLPPDAAGNPFPGSYDQPYYRTGIALQYWGKPAVRADFSPRDRILEEFEQSYIQIINETRNQLMEIYNTFVTTVQKLQKKYLKK